MNRFRFRDQAGLAGQILVGVVAWALAAVLRLTNTLVAAQQIDNRVDKITHTVGPIDHDLDSVKLAADTNRIAGEILVAAKPLSGQAQQIVDATASIDTSAKSINGDVQQIGESVNGIDANLAAVLDTAKQIRGDHAAPSSGFGTGIAGINRRADAVIALVQNIKADTANILASVLKIEASAKSIEGKVDQLTTPSSALFSLVL